jgi:hypothetical protein
MSRKVNWGVYSALFISLLVLIPHLPLIRAGRTFLKHYWSKVYLKTTYDFYSAILIALIPFLLFVIPASCWVAIVCARSTVRASLSLAEWISIVGISILPEIVIWGSLLTVRVFVYRYMLWSMIGIALVIAVLLGKWSRGYLIHGLICCVPLVVWCYYTSYHAYFDRPEFRYSQGLEQQLSRFPHKEITFASPHPFMELMHYGNAALRDRLIFVIDNDLEIRYKDTNTTFLILTALRRRNFTNVLYFQEFCRTHSTFILVDDEAGWLSVHLRNLGYSFLPQGGAETQRIYDVTAPTGLSCAAVIDTTRSLLSSPQVASN